MIAPPLILDTNVLVAAAFRPRSDPGRIVRWVRQGDLRMVWSPSTRHEARSVIQRIPPILWDPFAALFLPENRRPNPVVSRTLARVPDPSDRIFAALAQACGGILITRDDHLLACRNALPIDILTASEFLRSSFLDSPGSLRQEMDRRRGPAS